MQNKRDFTKKFIASLIVFMLAFTNFATLGSALVVYAADDNQNAINFSAQFVMISNNEQDNQESENTTNQQTEIQQVEEQPVEQENVEEQSEEGFEGQVEENSDLSSSIGSISDSFRAYESEQADSEQSDESSENLEEGNTEETENPVQEAEAKNEKSEELQESQESVKENDSITPESTEQPVEDVQEGQSQEQVLPNGLAIELTIGVNNSGYLKNAKIEIKDLANQIFTLKNDVSLGDYIQSVEDNKIKLKQINNGTEVKVYIPIEIKSEEFVNVEKLQKGTEFVLTTTYVNNEGAEEILKKTVNSVLSISNDLNLVVSSDIEKFIPYTKDGVNEALVQLRITVGSDTTNQLPIKDTQARITLPIIGDAQIKDVTVSAISTGFTNGLTNGEAIFTNENWNYQDGIVNISVDNVQKDGMYKKNLGNDEYIVSYKYSNIDDISNEKIKANVEVKSNVFTSDGTKEISNQIEKEYDLSQANSNIITYDLTRKTEQLSKGYLYGNANGNNAEYELEYDNALDINISRVDLVKLIEVRESDEYFVDIDGNRYSTDGNTYYKSIKVNREKLLSIIGENGNLEVLLEDGTSLIQINKDTPDEGDGYITISFGENKIGKILIRINNPVAEGILDIVSVKAMEKLTYEKIDLMGFAGIQSEFIAAAELTDEIVTEMGTKVVATEFTNTITDPSISLSRTELSTLMKNEGVEIEIALNNSRQTSDMYKNPVFELTLPREVKEVELKDMNLLYGNGELEIGNVETLKNEDGNIVLKITLNGIQTKYVSSESDKGTTIILKADMTVDMYTASRNAKIEMNYYNEDATNYGLGSDWNMITEPSSYMLNVRQGVYETALNIVAPEGFVNAQMISNYKDNASIISVDQGMKQDTIGTFKDARIAEMKMLIINNTNEDMENVSILGRTIFNGNKSIITGEALGANFDAPMVSKIDVGEGAKVYYSENGEATKDLDNKENGWVENIDDLSKVKSFLIVVDGKVNVGDILTYTYNFNIPEKLTNNIDLVGTFGTYYKGEFSDSVTEADKVLLTTGDAPVLTTEVTSDAEGSTVVPGQRIKYTVKVKNDGRTTSENVVVNQLIPDGTTYVNENGELEPNTTELKIELGKVAPGRTAEATYEVEVQGDTAVSSEISTNANVEADGLSEPIYVEPDKKLVDAAELYLSLDQIDKGRVIGEDIELDYTLSIMNLTYQEIDDCTVTQNLPEGLELTDAYIIGFEDDGLTEKSLGQATYDKNSRTVTWKIGTLKSTSMALKLKTKVSKMDVDSRNISTAATITSPNLARAYSSNEVKHTLARPIIEYNYKSSSDNRYLKEGETIKYTLNVKNTGLVAAERINIKNELPAGLNPVSATVTKDGITNNTLLGNVIDFDVNLSSNESAEIVLECSAKDLDNTTEERFSANNWVISGSHIDTFSTTKLENIIQQNPDLTNNTVPVADKMVTIEDVKNGNVQDIVQVNNSKAVENNVGTNNNTYRIIGRAFNDRNKNGQRDNDEEGMSDIVAKLCDTTSQKIACQTVTNSAGEYVFDNVVPGEYYVKFEYDSAKYQVTDYKKEGVNPDRNSDAIVSNYKAVTDKITITDSSISDIDIGFYRAGIFDLNIDANINRITVQNEDETNTYEMENSKLAKVDINPKYADSSKIFVEYTIDVSNKGEISGYAKSIMSYLPEQLELDTSLNANWYIGTDGNAHTRELENILIQPGETKTITLILTKQMTEEGTGLINNIFEIESDFNEYAISDIDSTPGNKADGEDDMSKADVIIGIQTGGSMINVMLISTTLITLLVVLYVIKLRSDRKDKEVVV